MRCFRNPRQDSNLRDFSINSLRNSPYSRLTHEGISQDVARDDILLDRNSISFGNYRRFPQQQPMRENFFFKNNLNNSPKFLDREEIFSRNKPARGYPLVVPSRQNIFDRSENLFFRNPRNKYSESLSEDYKRTQDNKKIEEDPSKVLVVYRADRDTKPLWKNSRDTLNVIQSERSLPKIENIYHLREEDILDEERNAVKKSSNSASQFRYPQEIYNPVRFGPSQIEHTSYIKDTDIPQSKEFFDNWDAIKDSSQTSNFGQLRNNLLEVHPVKKSEIITKNDNKQIKSNSYNSKFRQGLNTWESKKDGESFDSLMRINTRPFENEDEDLKEYFEDETQHFMNGEEMNEYFENETEQDTIENERDNYNSHVVPQNIWKDYENEELLEDFVRENSQETGQSGLYSEENNKYLQDEQNKDVFLQDKPYINTEATRAPVINAYNAYILPRYLNIVNDKKYPTKSETEELSEAKNNIPMNPIKEMNQRFFEDEAVIENDKGILDLVLPKDIFDIEKYNSPISDEQNNVRNKNEALTELDPDLLDDIEEPPVGTTESTSI